MSVSTSTLSFSDILFLAAMGVAVIVVIAVLAGLAWFWSRHSERRHAERMRAIELGYPLPESNFWPAFLALFIGAGVPLGACLMALITTVSMPNTYIVHPAWVVAGIIGGAGVVGGTILASVILATRRRSAPQVSFNSHRKPSFDPEAFDPVGHR